MGQKVGLDTSVFIYYLEDYKEYSDEADRWFKKIEVGDIQAVLSGIGLIEILTGPKKLKRFDLAKHYYSVIVNYPNLSIFGLNERIIEMASDLRAKYGFSVPDAVHLATAMDFGAEKFITNDASLKKIKEIQVEIL
ncbi:MAG: PIN domain-containing protein [Candidatus Doudnabacteria bacterium]|nr:PIN domain-containing protein [Candidatus Doudnabacteria bacterium]